MKDIFVIDPITRQVNIPGSSMVFGVEADAGSERKYFQCARYVGDNLDLAACFIRVNYRNANGDEDFYIVEDTTVNGDNVVFSWKIGEQAVKYKGQTKFVICAVGPDFKLKWHTTLATGIVLAGLEPENSHVEAATADVVAQLVAMVEAQNAAVESEGEKQVATVKAAAKAAETASVAEIEAKGVNTLASIPDDYTALSAAVDTVTRVAAPGIVCEVEGSTVAVNDASDGHIRGLRIFGRSTQDGTPTPDAPVEIVSIENPTVSVNEQAVNIQRTLPGIPVASGGNYTDENGQQWICDEVDFERGVYVQRVRNLVFSGGEEIDNTWYPVAIYHIHSPAPHINLAYNSVRSSHFRNVSCGNTLGTSLAIGNLNELGFASSDDLIAYFAEQYENNSPVTFQYAIAKPIETPLSETELAAYRALHTNKPNTTVLNDAGAYMAVAYTADTKLYIDNLIKNL